MPDMTICDKIGTKGQVIAMDTDEIFDEEMDEIFREIGRRFQEESSGTHIVNPKRMREFMACEEAMNRLFPGAKMEVLPQKNTPDKGVIRVFTKRLDIRDTKLFAAASSLADNYEIYTNTNGIVVLALMFYGMSIKVKE